MEKKTSFMLLLKNNLLSLFIFFYGNLFSLWWVEVQFLKNLRTILKCTTIVSCKPELFASIIFDLKWPPLLNYAASLSYTCYHQTPFANYLQLRWEARTMMVTVTMAATTIKTITTTMLWQQLMTTKLWGDNDESNNEGNHNNKNKNVDGHDEYNYNKRQQGIPQREITKT